MELNTPPAQPQLSLVRLALVLAVLGGALFLGWHWAVARVMDSRAEQADTWFAPYVDVTLTPVFHFEDPAEQPSSTVVLGFVVADPLEGCTASWGSYYSLDAAARALDLDRRIVRLRERGGDAIVSFGGALNAELATACTDVDKLVAAYQSVVGRYDLRVVDFDIEGSAVADAAANRRRAEAIRRLQAGDEDLEVWLTLPVAPQGLTAEGVELVDAMIAGGVRLAGVNAMTMNYAESRPSSLPMHDANVQALTSVWQQLDGAYQRAGTPLTQDRLWEMIGATPMIGQNDVPGDFFTQKDAQKLSDFAAKVDLGRLSFWSANRDFRCGAAIDDTRVSNTCSGTGQEPFAYAEIFGAGQLRPSGRDSGSDQDAGGGVTRDDPRTSPYPLWRSPKAYEEGAKVVWQGRVYEAKWWTQGDQPDAPVKQVWETPWRYLGPVLESDRIAVLAWKAAPDGARSRWTGERVYVAGDEVEHDGEAYRAKWWTQGDMPQEDPDQPYDHPWEYLGEVRSPGD